MFCNTVTLKGNLFVSLTHSLGIEIKSFVDRHQDSIIDMIVSGNTFQEVSFTVFLSLQFQKRLKLTNMHELSSCVWLFLVTLVLSEKGQWTVRTMDLFSLCYWLPPFKPCDDTFENSAFMFSNCSKDIIEGLDGTFLLSISHGLWRVNSIQFPLGCVLVSGFHVTCPVDAMWHCC